MCGGGGGKEKDKDSSRSKVSILCGNKPERANVVLFWESPTFQFSLLAVCVRVQEGTRLREANSTVH